MDSNALTIEQEASRWLSVSTAPGRFGAVAFRYGKREIGHLHRDRIADLPVTPEIREDLIAKGRARPHRAGVKGYASYPIQGSEVASVVIEVLGRNYDCAKVAAESVARSRAASQRDTEDEA